MRIHCTKKLLDELKLKPEEVRSEVDPFYSWHANVMLVNRRKTVVFVNDHNRYVVVLHGLKAKDFKKLDEHFIHAVREAFQQEHIKEEIIDQYLEQAQEISFAKTNDRTTVARMNKSCEQVTYFEDLFKVDSLFQGKVSRRASTFLVGHGKKDYIVPNEELYKDLEKLAGGPIFDVQAVEMLVTLKLDKHHVWRRLVVPVNQTFEEFHDILQSAFGWKNQHLYEFYLFDPDTTGYDHGDNHPGVHKEGLKPILNVVCHEEAFAYETKVPMKWADEVHLSDFLSAKIKYHYDFGDSWQHDVEIVKEVPDYTPNHPVCLDGGGNTPPEDVGGEGGYEEFLAVYSNPEHPDYTYTHQWGLSQGYTEFNLDRVNRRLK
ncbi:plasmid pRiA4b ORF-3 family protein [Bacillus tuaregi]|uniref:plasmid pRiA4b ORF-3 family protein n=1 Tax=Bacillus tuaregi TaxID=1816695 RepID=UPI0008F81ACA|nr:plasmid pRiA4b ORF-3 family protein [Bacillus tuaregi]